MIGTLARIRRAFAARPDFFIGIILALAAFGIYLRTLAPGVLDGDSGEWQYMANILGIPHSTGYPLYILLAKLFSLVPVGEPAWRVNLFSAVCAALTVPLVYALAIRVARSHLAATRSSVAPMRERGAAMHSRVASIIAASLFALSPMLWGSAVEAEVYALNTFLMALTLFFAVRWFDAGRTRDLYAMALTFGLALDNHRIALFLAPALLLLLWLRRNYLSRRRIATTTALALVPLLLYLYIPLRASQLLADQSTADWQLYPRAEAILKGTVSAYYNPSPYGFVNLVTGFDNRNKLGFEETATGSALDQRLLNAATLLLQQFDAFAVVLIVAGIVLVLRRERELTFVLLTGALSIASVSLLLRAESTLYYFSGVYLILALFFAAALGALLSRAGNQNLFRGVLIAFMSLFPITALLLNFPQMDRSGAKAYDTYARSILADTLAPNAVVVAPWEIATPLRYLQLVEHQRPDLLVIHESPVRKQFQALLTSAHSLKRPFYLVQFTPQDKNAAGARTVQAIGLPLLSKPQPHYPLDVRLTDSVRGIGFDLSPDPARVGQFARLALYYQVLSSSPIEYKSELELDDIRSAAHGIWSRTPVSEYYPTYLWQPGEYYRDVWDIPLAPDAPSGLYNFELSWYPFDAATNATDREHPQVLNIGPVRVGNFEIDTVWTNPRAHFANGITLHGFRYSSANTAPRDKNARMAEIWTLPRGQTMTVSLLWRADQPIKDNYTVFVHLVGVTSGIHAQSDKQPWDGMFPTSQWRVGEKIQDNVTLQIPADLQPGDYHLRVGMYLDPRHPVNLSPHGYEIDASFVTLEFPLHAFESP